MGGSDKSTKESQSPEKKSGWLGKIVGWGIAVAIAVFIVNLRGGQKDEWFEQQHQRSVGWCKGDAKCLGVVEQHWKHCVDDNHESTRRGKYNRKYTLDESGYRSCLAGSGADLLANSR
jgi:hypothetical protein